jgi:hypothetical protein
MITILSAQVSRQLAAGVTAQSRGFAEAAVATEQIDFDELAKNVSVGTLPLLPVTPACTRGWQLMADAVSPCIP